MKNILLLTGESSSDERLKAVPWSDRSCVLRIYRVYVGTKEGTDDRKKRERMEDYVREKINEMLTVTRQP